MKQVARGALQFRRFAAFVRPALINGAAGVVVFDGEQPFALLAFTLRSGRAVAIEIFNDRQLVPKLVRHPRFSPLPAPAKPAPALSAAPSSLRR